MELRAHHLLCIPMYQGHGYSEGFCAHMSEVINRIKTSEEVFRPLASPDEICSHCPNLQPPVQLPENDGSAKRESEIPELKNRYCDHEKNTSRKDAILLENFGLICGRYYRREELRETVLSHMTEEIFDRSCGKCQWHEQGLCSFELWRNNFREFF